MRVLHDYQHELGLLSRLARATDALSINWRFVLCTDPDP